MVKRIHVFAYVVLVIYILQIVGFFSPNWHVKCVKANRTLKINASCYYQGLFYGCDDKKDCNSTSLLDSRIFGLDLAIIIINIFVLVLLFLVVAEKYEESRKEMRLMASCIFASTVSMLLVDLVFGVNGCSDVYPQLCQLLQSKHTGLCNDQCIANVCQKSCGKCPLQCYACHQVDDVSQCTSTQLCPNADDVCFSTQTFTDRFTESFTMGCAARQSCNQYSSITRRINVDAGCCDADLCNNKPPVLLHLQNLTRSNEITTQVSGCVDVDSYLCQHIKQNVPDLCKQECIASKICPNTCARCFQCLHCDAVESPNACTTRTNCTDGKECFIAETLQLTTSQRPAIKLGCTSEQLCHHFHNRKEIPQLFGRRQEGFAIHGSCCKGHLCNQYLSHPSTTNGYHSASTTTNLLSTLTHAFTLDKQTTAMTVSTSAHQQKTTTSNTLFMTSLNSTSTIFTKKPMTTSATTPPDCTYVIHNRCPGIFFSLHHSCYATGPLALTYKEAKAYCDRQCLHLAEFGQMADLTAVTKHFQHRGHGLSFYIGATGNSDGLQFLWNKTGLGLDPLLWVKYASQGACAVTRELITLNVHDRQHSEFGLENVNCSTLHRPLCQLNLHN